MIKTLQTLDKSSFIRIKRTTNQLVSQSIRTTVTLDTLDISSGDFAVTTNGIVIPSGIKIVLAIGAQSFATATGNQLLYLLSNGNEIDGVQQVAPSGWYSKFQVVSMFSVVKGDVITMTTEHNYTSSLNSVSSSLAVIGIA